MREGLAVSKQVTNTFDADKFNYSKLHELEVRKWY
jgi:hypothetical protein